MAIIFVALTTLAAAQETPSPTPTPTPTATPGKAIRITFLPPPLEGAISLGIYDGNGKLVRVLHREAETDDFEIGNDALSTTWDGRDDAGGNLPPGTYHARGFVVGEVVVEGVGFFFNDWVTEDQSVHIAKITGLAADNGVPVLAVQIPPNESATVVCDASGNVVTTGEARPLASPCQVSGLAEVLDPVACAPGKGGTQWVIDRVSKGSAETELEQFSPAKELLRRLSIPANEPQPRAIAASLDAETIFLLEENEAGQRLRGLSLITTKSDGGRSISDWKVDFEKEILAHKDFTIADGKPVLRSGKTPPEKIAVKLLANPLDKNKTSVELAVGADEDGSFLKTADGLPLESISDTPHLQRVLLAPRSANSIDVFQDDGAVVEQFRITGLDEMMAFDCGEIELK